MYKTKFEYNLLIFNYELNSFVVRALQTEIKNNSYDRLIDKPNKV